MHQDFGPWTRFLINRDSTFLALLGGLTQEGPSRMATCCNPLAPAKRIYDSGLHMEYAADVTLCALDMKLCDDAADERFARRILSRVGSRSFSYAKDRAIARLNWGGFPTAEVAESILGQEQIEATNPKALAAAQPTAEAYGEILAFSHRFRADKGTEPVLRRLGISLGRLIYWDDAWNDWKKDQQQGRFNPLQNSPPEEIRELMVAEFTQFEKAVQSLATSPASSTLNGIIEQTRLRLPLAEATPGGSRRKKKPRKEGSNKCFQHCDCCPCGDCGSPKGCDACFDCGPGDTGCCDCCPCDG